MAWLLGLQPTTKEKAKGKRLARLRGSSPPSKESNLLAPYHLRGPVLGETSATNFSGRPFLEPSIPYTSEALKKENVKENLGKARLSIRQFSPFNCLFSIE
jgi:hypothetical protein